MDFYLLNKLSPPYTHIFLGCDTHLKISDIRNSKIWVFLVLENILTLAFAVGQQHILNNHFDTEVEC